MEEEQIRDSRCFFHQTARSQFCAEPPPGPGPTSTFILLSFYLSFSSGAVAAALLGRPDLRGRRRMSRGDTTVGLGDSPCPPLLQPLLARTRRACCCFTSTSSSPMQRSTNVSAGPGSSGGGRSAEEVAALGGGGGGWRGRGRCDFFHEGCE